LINQLDSQPVWQVRVRILKALGATIGKNVVFRPGVIFDNPEKIMIGDNVSINHRCYLSAAGNLRIGSNVSIAHDCSIMSSTHSFENESNIRTAPLRYAPVLIGSNVWIGMKTAILLGVAIGDNTVIGACSLVNKPLPGNGVYVGIPAKQIKSITQDSN